MGLIDPATDPAAKGTASEFERLVRGRAVSPRESEFEKLLKRPPKSDFEKLLEREYRPRASTLERGLRGVSRAARVFGPIGAVIGVMTPSELGSGELSPEQRRKIQTKTQPQRKTKPAPAPPPPMLPPKPVLELPRLPRPTPPSVPRPVPGPIAFPDPQIRIPKPTAPSRARAPKRPPKAKPAPKPRPIPRRAPTAIERLWREFGPRLRRAADAVESERQLEPILELATPSASSPVPLPVPDLTTAIQTSAESARDRCRCDDGSEGRPPRPSNKIAAITAYKRRMSQNSLDNLRKG